MGETINGCDTVDNGVPSEQSLATVPANACAEIDMSGLGWTGEVKTAPSTHMLRQAVDAGQRVLIIAPTGHAARALREHLANADVPVTPIADMRDEGEGGIAVESIDDLRVGGTVHSTIMLTGQTAARMRSPSSRDVAELADVSFGGMRDMDDYKLAMDLTGVMMVIDESGDIDREHLGAVQSWLGRPFGPSKSATAFDNAMLDGTMDSIFGDDVIERERRSRHSYVLIDDDRQAMRGLSVMAARACLPESNGFDYRCENDAFNRRNGTRAKHSRNLRRRYR